MKSIQTWVIFLLSFWVLFAEAQQKDTIETRLNNNDITFGDGKKMQDGKQDFVNQIGISTPFIWSHSEASFYSLGALKHPSGKDMNYGIALNYSRSIYNRFFGIIGIGYFNQRFSIQRPFNYVTPDNTKPLIATKYYAYYNIYWMAGVGYKQILTKDLAVKGVISYNNYNSYRQRYAQEYYPGINEVYKKNIPIGYMINLNAGIEKNITKRISVGTGIVLPLQIHWNNDNIFINNFYSPSEQQIASNIFSIGIAFSCNYRF